MVNHVTAPAAPAPSGSAAPGGIRSMIISRPLISFFVLAYAMSWLAWTPYVLSRNGIGVLGFGFPALLGTSQLLGVLPGAYLGPILSAIIVTSVAYGRAGIAEWLGRFRRWRVRWPWYLVAIIGMPAALTVSGAILTGGHGIKTPTLALLINFLPMLALQFVTTGLAEEPGWRDFALPQLQPRFGPLRASLILGPLWGAWHLPLFFSDWGGWPDVTVVTVIEFVLTAMAICIVMTWVFNRTGQSLPLQMILHSSINSYATLVWPSLFPSIDSHAATTRGVLVAVASAAIILIIATRGRLGRR